MTAKLSKSYWRALAEEIFMESGATSMTSEDLDKLAHRLEVRAHNLEVAKRKSEKRAAKRASEGSNESV